MTRVALIGAQLEESLALLSLEAALRQAGHETVRVSFDRAVDRDRVVEEVRAVQPELVGLSMVFTRRAREFAELAQSLRDGGFEGHLTCGGHFATFNASRLLHAVPAVDSVVTGEGEETLAELAGSLEDPALVPGLWLGSGPTAHRAPCLDLDRRPWPVRDARRDSYLGFPIANLLAGRGCYGSCVYCSIRAWHRVLGTEHRPRRVEAVAAEMAELYHRLGVRIFNFHDDNFFLPDQTASRERFVALRAALDRERVGRIAVAVKARPDSIEPESLRALLELGLFRVFLGVENGSDRSLAELGRRSTAAASERALELLGSAGIHVCYNLLLFAPLTRPADVEDNLRFLERHRDFPMNFCRTEVYAGTPLEAWLRRSGRLLGDWWGLDYTCEDPRVEACFCAVHHAFHQRCFDVDGLHHLAMRVDYLRQVAAHFLPELVRGEVEGGARSFVRRVVSDSLAHLAEVVAWAGLGGSPPGRRETGRFAEELRSSLERARAALEPVACELIRRLEGLADLPEPSQGGLRRFAAAATAAVLLEGAAACGRPQPPPPTPSAAATAPASLVPMLGPDDALKVLLRGPTPERVREFFETGPGHQAWCEELACWSAGRGGEPGGTRPYDNLRVAMVVDGDGRIVALRLMDPPEIPDDLLPRLRALVTAVRLPAGGEAGAVIVSLGPRTQRTHVFEMIAISPGGRGDRR